MRIPSKSFEFMKKVSKTRTRSRTTGTERFREKPRVARFATSSPATKKKLSYSCLIKASAMSMEQAKDIRASDFSLFKELLGRAPSLSHLRGAEG